MRILSKASESATLAIGRLAAGASTAQKLEQLVRFCRNFARKQAAWPHVQLIAGGLRTTPEGVASLAYGAGGAYLTMQGNTIGLTMVALAAAPDGEPELRVLRKLVRRLRRRHLGLSKEGASNAWLLRQGPLPACQCVLTVLAGEFGAQGATPLSAEPIWLSRWAPRSVADLLESTVPASPQATGFTPEDLARWARLLADAAGQGRVSRRYLAWFLASTTSVVTKRAVSQAFHGGTALKRWNQWIYDPTFPMPPVHELKLALATLATPIPVSTAASNAAAEAATLSSAVDPTEIHDRDAENVPSDGAPLVQGRSSKDRVITITLSPLHFRASGKSPRKKRLYKEHGLGSRKALNAVGELLAMFATNGTHVTNERAQAAFGTEGTVRAYKSRLSKILRDLTKVRDPIRSVKGNLVLNRIRIEQAMFLLGPVSDEDWRHITLAIRNEGLVITYSDRTLPADTRRVTKDRPPELADVWATGGTLSYPLRSVGLKDRRGRRAPACHPLETLLQDGLIKEGSADVEALRRWAKLRFGNPNIVYFDDKAKGWKPSFQPA